MALRRRLPVTRSFLSTATCSQASGRPRLGSVGKGIVPEWERPRRDGIQTLLPTGAGLQGWGVRYFGLIDKMQGKADARSKREQEEEFRTTIKSLSEVEDFNLNGFYDCWIEKPLSKWTAKMPWNSNMPEMVDLKKQKAVIENMPTNLRENPSLIRDSDRISAAEAANCSIDDVHLTLYKFREMRGISRWLVERKSLGQKIPDSVDEMHKMIADPAGVKMTKFMKKKVAKSGRGAQYTF